MLAFFGLLFLAAMSATKAETVFKIMDSETPLLPEKSCIPLCSVLMDLGLQGISLAFQSLLKELHFSAGFCDCVITGLGNFTFTESCSSNAEGDMFDHEIKVFFKKPWTTCSCPLSNNPSAAAEKIMNSDNPHGQCGKDNIQDKMPKASFQCDNDESGVADTDKPVELECDLSNGVLDMAFRVDTRDPAAVVPLSITFTAMDDPFSVKDGPGFEKSWECLNSEANRPTFFRKLFFNAYKRVFDCLTDNAMGNSRSIIDALLYYGGNCKNYMSLG